MQPKKLDEGCKQPSDEWSGLALDLKRRIQLNDGDPRLSLLQKDSETYQVQLENILGKQQARMGNRTIAKRFKDIFETIIEKFDTPEKLLNFYGKLNSVTLLRISVSHLADAFTVFSSLNGKGLPLTMIDLLKAHFLGLPNNQYPEKKANEKWNSLITIFSAKKDSQTRSSEITRFLLNNFDTFESTKESSITKGQALKEYQKVFDAEGTDYIETLLRRAKVYSLLSPGIVATQDFEIPQTIAGKLDDLSKLDSSQGYPLMLQVLDMFLTNKIDEELVLNILDQLIHFFVRRNLVLQPKSSNIRSAMISIIRKMQSNVNILSVNSYIDEVKNELSTSSSNDQEFELALTGPVYDVSPKTVRFILISLETKYGSSLTKEHRDFDETAKTKSGRELPYWSIEHILPESENLKNGWPEMISPDNPDEAPRLQQENMHKLGNLTLTAYNPAMGEKSFVSKRDYTPNEGISLTGLRTALFLNESISDPQRNEKIENKETWTIEDINRRTNYLAKLVETLFPIR